ncbi:MAG: methylated-DNA--[protein]-cysteine S-methyltransferase [Phycisphaerae bacterium]|nr:methylated-DNA--[protein]-cysteine S-methyltransferase [Phycisphaerae bacterium]
MWFDSFSSPIGTLTVAADSDALCHVLFANDMSAIPGRAHWRRDAAAMQSAREQLLAYFAGERTSFDLVLRPSGTPFQVRVWSALARIPFGVTWSYAELARRIGAPKAVRAVGGANARNPLPIVLPCHRVIGSDGSLTGFGGGMPAKRLLLHLERPAYQVDAKCIFWVFRLSCG